MIYGEWILVEGFELTQADNILTMYHDYGQYASIQKAGHITIRNNWIHDASFMGVYANGVPDLLFEGNTFERNGLGPKNCVSDIWADHTAQGFGYVHCHGIYLGNATGYPAIARVTVRRNKFIFNTGSGLQNRFDGMQGTNYLIENNLFINNQRGMNISDLNNSTIRNNTIVQFDYPRPNSSDKACFFINHIPNNTIANNACYLALNPSQQNMNTMWNPDPKDPQNGVRFSHNGFFVWPNTNWIWGNNSVKDFLNSYKSMMGDTAGITKAVVTANGSEAGFVNAQAGDLHLLSSSPLKGTGDSTYCATVDFDGKSRTTGTCDIGAYDFGP